MPGSPCDSPALVASSAATTVSVAPAASTKFGCSEKPVQLSAYGDPPEAVVADALASDDVQHRLLALARNRSASSFAALIAFEL